MAIKTIRVFAEYTSDGYVPMPSQGNIDYGVTVGSTFPETQPSSFQTDDPNIDVAVTTMTDYYVWIRTHGSAWNPSYTRVVRVYPDSPSINSVVMNMIVAVGGGGTTISSGGGVSYYLNGGTSQGVLDGSTYYEMNKVPVEGTGVDFFKINTTGFQNIAQFVTDAGDPGLLNIPAGNWPLGFFMSASDNSGAPKFYAEIYKYSAAGVFTLLGSSVATPEVISNGQAIDYYTSTVAIPDTTLLVTDRIAIRIFVNTDGNRTINLHTQDSHLSTVGTTFTRGLTAINGLIKQVQFLAIGNAGSDAAIVSSDDTHTINLPTASATKRGLLSGTDWSTFNAKQPALSGDGFVKISGSTISYDNSSYQPLDGDLTAIGALAGTSGILKKTGANTWALDTTVYLNTTDAASTYQRLDKMVSNLLASDTEYPNSNAVLAALALKANATNPAFSGYLTISGASPKIYLTDTDNNPDYFIGNDDGYFRIYDQTNSLSRFYITNVGVSTFPGDVIVGTIAKSGGTASQFLKADGTVDSTAYATSASLADYLTSATAATTYQRLDKMVSNLLASDTEYPNSNAVLAKLALKANAADPQFTGSMNIKGAESRINFYDENDAIKYFIGYDSGFLRIYQNAGSASRLYINSSGKTFIPGTLEVGTIIKTSGLATEFLKADGTVDSNTYALNSALADYLTTVNAAATYQPLDGDLTSIAGLTGTSGLLKKTAANTWVLDTTAYLTAEADTLATVVSRGSSTTSQISISSSTLQHLVLADRFHLIGGTNFHLTNNAYYDGAFRYKDSVSTASKLVISGSGTLIFDYAPIGTANSAIPFTSVFIVGTDGVVSAGGFVKSNGTSSQFLKADGSVDANTYLTTTSAASTYQRVDKMVSNLLASDTEYPNSNAVLAKLALKADAANPTFTGNFTISGDSPKLYFVDTDNNPDYTLFADSGYFYIYDQTAGATRFSINSSGYATFNKRVNFQSGIDERPQLPGGFVGLDTGDGNFDIWGISRDYYPSHATAANAWGIRWNGDNNDIQFVGGGSNVALIDLDNGKITGGSFVKTGGTSSQFLKADGSVDTSTYLTTTSADSTYLKGTTNPGTPGNFTLSIGNNGTYSYVQSHSSQPLELNPIGNAVRIAGNVALHAGNYSSYALPLSGGTVTGIITNSTSYIGYRAQSDGTSTAWRGIIGSYNATADIATFIGNYAGRSGIFGHNNGMSAWNTLRINTLGMYGMGKVILSNNTVVNANDSDTEYGLIHAGNITSQSVTFATNSSKLYSTDSAYNYNSANPYYGYLTYDGNYWQFKVSPATPDQVRVYTADRLGGNAPNQTGGANTIVQRDSNGYIQNSYFYTSGGGSERGTGISYIAGFNSSDYYIRSYTLQGLASAMSGSSMNINGNAATATRANGNFYIDNNYGNTIVGVYTSTRYQGVFAMGDSYKLPADGTTTGSLYGLAWSHPNAGGIAGNLNTHGLLVMENGTFLAAISGNIKARDGIVAGTYMYAPNYIESGGAVYGTIFYDNNDRGYYLDPNTSGTSLRIAGNIHSDGSFGTNGYSSSSPNVVSRVFAPKGAAFSSDGSTGAIRIKLPFRGNNPMWTMKVRIYNYATNQTSEYLLGNYAYDQGGYNSSATFMGGSDAPVHVVRFGNQDGVDCVWIGETNTGWSYPVVSVLDFTSGFRASDAGSQGTNWDIAIVTSFGTIGSTINPNVKFSGLSAYSIQGTSNVAGTGSASYHPSGIYSTGTNWLYGTMYLNGYNINGGGAIYGNDIYTTGGWFRNHTNNNGIYWSNTGWHLMPNDSSDFRIHSGNNTDASLRLETNGSVRGYFYTNNSNEVGILTNDRNWGFRLNSSKNAFLHGNQLTIGQSQGSSSIYMYDSDEGTREIHCNSNRIGFLNQSSSWGAWCNDDGSWEATKMYAYNGLSNNQDVSNDSTFGLWFNGFGVNSYAIYREPGGWSHPYPDLRIAFHTGISLGANPNYGGVRFFSDYDMSTVVLYVNNASYGGAGNVYAVGSVTATAFYESSDSRLKNLLEDDIQVKGIENLKAKRYIKNGKEEYGYFAQEAETYMPSVVTRNSDGYLNLSYREVHTAKIARLEQRVAELEKQLNVA